MDNKEILKYKIFGEDGCGLNAMKLLRATPYGKQVISAQIQAEIRRRLGIPMEASGDCSAQVRWNATTPEGEDVYLVWSDVERSSKTEEEINEAVDVVEKELTGMGLPNFHFYVTYLPKVEGLK